MKRPLINLTAGLCCTVGFGCIICDMGRWQEWLAAVLLGVTVGFVANVAGGECRF